MLNYFFGNYMEKMYFISKNIGYLESIKADKIEVEKNKINLFICNHISVLDNFILSKIFFENNYTWNNLKSISRITKKPLFKWKNITLKIHDHFLSSGNFTNDVNQFEIIADKWIKKSKNTQIVIFPEGIIYNDSTKNEELSKSQKYIMENKLKINKFNNLLFPNIGIYNMIIQKLENHLDNIYDLSISYTDNKNKRIYNEEILLDHLAKNDLKINVKIDRYDVNQVIKDPYWLFKIWKQKDQWINEVTTK